MDIHDMPGTKLGNCRVECLLEELSMIGRVVRNEGQVFLSWEVT